MSDNHTYQAVLDARAVLFEKLQKHFTDTEATDLAHAIYDLAIATVKDETP